MIINLAEPKSLSFSTYCIFYLGLFQYKIIKKEPKSIKEQKNMCFHVFASYRRILFYLNIVFVKLTT